MKIAFRHFFVISAIASFLPLGCTDWYAHQADKAAYKTVAGGQKAALGTTQPFNASFRPFTADPNSPSVIRVGSKTVNIGGDASKTVKLNLTDCLEIAFRNSRFFQDHNETLYTQALALANARRSWDYPLINGSVTGDAEISKENKGQRTQSGEANVELNLTQRFVDGGVLTAGLALDLATDFAGGNGTTIGSLMNANFTQPLLKGAWHGFAYEDQYRLNRDFLISVFEFNRFAQTFAADILMGYYQVLQRQDQLRNEKENIKRLEQTVMLTRILVEGGRVSRIELDQSNQNLFNAQIRYESDLQSYRNSLDTFKITIGLPVLANVELDYPADLELLAKDGLKDLGFDEEKAISTALAVRPDVLTRRAGLRDAQRNVEIATNAFLPQLDVTAGIEVPSAGQRNFYDLRFDRHTRFANVVFNYPIDQTDNRDAYRNSMLTMEKARRDYQEFLDRVRLEVRAAYRELTQSQKTYDLQVRNVNLAKRRRALAVLQQREGQASARDVLEAESDLRDAQNGLTSALVSYATTRLKFLANLGMMEVDGKGMLHEREKPFEFERIGRRYRYLAAE